MRQDACKLGVGALATCALLAVAVLADEVVATIAGPDADASVADAPGSPWTSTLEVAGPPLSDRVVVVVDVSGSMQGVGLAKAGRIVERLLAERPASAAFALFAFGDRCERFEPEWARAADPAAVERALAWLSARSANTTVALDEAMTAAGAAARARGAHVVLVSDGLLDPAAVLDAPAPGSPAHPLDPPVHTIGVFTASRSDQGQDVLAAIARERAGSFIAWRLDAFPARLASPSGAGHRLNPRGRP